MVTFATPALALIAHVGCSSILGIEDFSVADARTSEADAESGFCLGPSGWRICVATEPTNALSIPASLQLETATSALCASAQPASWKAGGQPDACFLIGSRVELNAPSIRALGTRPLVIFASDTITVNTELAVASDAAAEGPATPSAACVQPQPAANNTSAAGGGAGASFGGKGGDGGTSSNGTLGGRAAVADDQVPSRLRGGCSGGGGGNAGPNGGTGGVGGGPIYLVAKNRIAINGFINASGAAGGGGGALAGGGGGGSGGMIVLHAPSIVGDGSAALVANGGGGGGGGSGTSAGLRGADPSAQMPLAVAAGGAGGGAGGGGFAGMTNPTAGAAGSPVSANAGGGGGGGAGYIRANVSPTGLTTSPIVDIVPH